MTVRLRSITASSAGARVIALVTVGALVVSCAEPPPPPPFRVFVKVESDPGRPIQNAVVSRNGKQLGTTGGDGRSLLEVPGSEGEGAIVGVTVACPEGFTSPKAAVNIRLTRLADKTKVPEYGVACPPTVRQVVVAVRADNGPNLPVLYLNKPVTRTDEGGAAHFALEMPPGAQFQVVLDTSERKDLKPQMPGKIFVVAQQDDILVLDQKFDVERKVVHVAAKPQVPRALLPVRRD